LGITLGEFPSTKLVTRRVLDTPAPVDQSVPTQTLNEVVSDTEYCVGSGNTNCFPLKVLLRTYHFEDGVLTAVEAIMVGKLDDLVLLQQKVVKGLSATWGTNCTGWFEAPAEPANQPANGRLELKATLSLRWDQGPKRLRLLAAHLERELPQGSGFYGIAGLVVQSWVEPAGTATNRLGNLGMRWVEVPSSRALAEAADLGMIPVWVDENGKPVVKASGK
jgi:hypothetical protein